MDYNNLGITAISEENPSGVDIRYDEDFELIEAQISKLTSPSASSKVDWEVVSKLSSKILESKSKNILVTVYFSYALFKQHGIDGLVDGVKVLVDILQNYWETLYPPKKRMKGRINAIAWWIDKISKDLENLNETEIESQKKTALIENLQKVDDFLNEAIDDAPLFYNLIKLLDMKLIIQQSELKEEAVAEKTQEGLKEEVDEPLEEKKTQKVKREVSSLSGNLEDDFKATVNSLNILTGEMIEAKDYRSELFMINRAFAWLDIDEPPSSEKNMTMLNPPDTQEIELLASLYDEKKYEALLWAAESRITTYLFWLDLHYYVAESLEQLNHKEASLVVYEQASYFIKKLPNLEKLTFSDATPFASKATRKWLKPKELKQESTTTTTNESEDDTNFTSIDALNDRMNRSSSVQEEVLCNIEICKFLLLGKSSTLISTYTQRLLDTIEIYKTDKWNPKIAIEAYSVSIECLKVIDEDSEILDSLLRKIALLKPSLVDEFN